MGATGSSAIPCAEASTECTGSRTNPWHPAGFQTLIAPAPQTEYGQILRDEDLKGPQGSQRIWVEDINADGKLDILVGDMVPLISPADGLTDAEFNKRFAEWRMARDDELGKLRKAAVDEKGRAKLQQRVQEIYNQRSQLMKENMTGFD